MRMRRRAGRGAAHGSAGLQRGTAMRRRAGQFRLMVITASNGGRARIRRFGSGFRVGLRHGAPWMLFNLHHRGLENLDEAHSNPRLHVAAGPGLAEECATLDAFCFLLATCLGGCRTGMAKMTNAYDLPARVQTAHS
ncbi:hypothetical protein C2845_PM03G20280 [Panicum miliaceum]|uniref:Uncharacterized protein n=1 Tax=Panicum miliaceum TaxID=4540 RepID=A0A3L6T7S4_PANMI|nr:hypothetical protein C2845_PM03G20280 [Panicum miliaceum]